MSAFAAGADVARRPGKLLALARAVLAGSAWGLTAALDLNFPVVLTMFAGLAAVRLDLALPIWVALTGLLGTPVLVVRSSVVLFGTAALSFLLILRFVGLLAGERPRPLPALWVGCLGAFACVVVASGVHGALDYDPTVPGVHRFLLAQIYAAGLAVLPLAAAWLMADQTSSTIGLRRVYVAVLAITAIRVAGDLVEPPLLPEMIWWETLSAHSAALIYAVLLVSPPKRRHWRIAGLGLLTFVSYDLVVEPFLFASHGQWVSGWIMLSVPLIIITLVRLSRHPRLALASMPVVAAAAWLAWPRAMYAYRVAEAEGDFGRLLIWRDAIALALRRPVLGVGPGNYIDYIERYALWHPYGSAHGNYQQVAAEMGFAGLTALLATILVTGAYLWKLYRRAEDSFVRAFALGAFGTLIGQASAAVVGDYLIPSYHNGGHTTFASVIFTWIIAGAAIGLSRRGPR